METNRHWDLAYQEARTPWDHGEAAPPLTAYLVYHRLRGRILVPGCGPGHDVAALHHRGMHVCGVDLAPTAVAQARARYPSVPFAVANFLALPPRHVGVYAWVVEHTLFCALDPVLRPAYVRAAHRALKPGGRLFAIFYLRPDDDFLPWDGPPYGVLPTTLRRLFLRQHFSIERAWRPKAGWPSRQGRELVAILRRRG